MAKKVSLWDAHCRRFNVLNTLHGKIMDSVLRVYGKGEPELEQALVINLVRAATERGWEMDLRNRTWWVERQAIRDEA